MCRLGPRVRIGRAACLVALLFGSRESTVLERVKAPFDATSRCRRAENARGFLQAGGNAVSFEKHGEFSRTNCGTDRINCDMSRTNSEGSDA